MFINIRNSKPVEKRGRKAMGLQLQAQSRQPGCRRKNLLNIFASLVTSPGLFFWNLIIRSFDKGKPGESRGRKAMGLKPGNRKGPPGRRKSDFL